jgi:hypothetical protein
MKEKYADQDEDERAMRLTLLGAKDVKGFDIVKHGNKKTKYIEKQDQSEEEEESEDEDEEED